MIRNLAIAFDQERMSSSDKTTKEPSDTALHQQRMLAWNPVLDPIGVAITFIAISAIFIPVGMSLPPPCLFC